MNDRIFYQLVKGTKPDAVATFRERMPDELEEVCIFNNKTGKIVRCTFIQRTDIGPLIKLHDANVAYEVSGDTPYFLPEDAVHADRFRLAELKNRIQSMLEEYHDLHLAFDIDRRNQSVILEADTQYTSGFAIMEIKKDR